MSNELILTLSLQNWKNLKIHNCPRVCVLLLSIVSLDHMVILFKPAVHKDYFTLLHIKTSIAGNYFNTFG